MQTEMKSDTMQELRPPGERRESSYDKAQDEDDTLLI